MIRDLIKSHETYRKSTINLIPSENDQSKYVKYALSSDLAGRYYFRNPFITESGSEYKYQGSKYVSKIFDKTEILVKKLFNAKFVSLSMISGHQCTIALLLKHCTFGDNIICTSTYNGGYPGLDPQMLPKFLGINVYNLPQINGIGSDVDTYNLEKILSKVSCKMLFLSHSVVLFPYNLREIRNICDKFGVILVYDASHPLGLIAGNSFQKPLEEGAHYLIGSTHKSLPGPQGGIVLSNVYKIDNVSDFITVDNFSLGRVAALGAVCEEMNEYGNEYAKAVIRNSKALAKTLSKNNLPVLYSERDFTESHQVLLDISSFKDYPKFTNMLEENGIIVDNSGRLGTCEITLKGTKPSEIEALGEFITDIFFQRKNSLLNREIVKHISLKERSFTFD